MLSRRQTQSNNIDAACEGSRGGTGQGAGRDFSRIDAESASSGVQGVARFSDQAKFAATNRGIHIALHGAESLTQAGRRGSLNSHCLNPFAERQNIWRRDAYEQEVQSNY
jgi:hypothetical protein